MSLHSGYDVLYQHLHSAMVAEVDSIFCDHTKIFPRGMGRVLSTITPFARGTSFYNAPSFEAELRVFIELAQKKYDVVHYSYAEPYFGLGSRFRGLIKSKLILTNHQPTAWWDGNPEQINSFSKADLIIVLSEYDREYWLQKNGHSANVAFVPHGVDTNFYQPKSCKQEKEHFNILFTGRYLRDIDVLVKVVKQLSPLYPTFNFDIVYFPKESVQHLGLREIMIMPNVRWHSGISDFDLLSIYQAADCLLLPLESCTANNAVLEAMACGLPIVTSDLQPLRSYVNDKMACLIRDRNIDDFCEALIILSQQNAKRANMSLESRKRALELFDWANVAKLTSSHIKNVHG